MKLTIYQIDSFADKLFAGNPAAVIPLDKWIDDSLMQQLAMENNLAETAFFVPKGNDFEIRWFTPALEINLCGHATLASAFVLFNFLEYKSNTVTFHQQLILLYLLKMANPTLTPKLLSESPDISTGQPKHLMHSELFLHLSASHCINGLRNDATNGLAKKKPA